MWRMTTQNLGKLNFVLDGSFVHLFMYVKQNFTVILCHHVFRNTVVFSTHGWPRKFRIYPTDVLAA